MRPSSVGAEEKIARMMTGDAILVALDALDVTYYASEKEAVMPCIFHNDTGKPNFSMNVQDKPGVFRCFVCGAKGDFTSYLVQLTGWPVVKILQFCRKIRLQVEEDGVPERAPKTPPPDQVCTRRVCVETPLSLRARTERRTRCEDLTSDSTSSRTQSRSRGLIARVISLRSRSGTWTRNTTCSRRVQTLARLSSDSTL